MIRIVGSSSLRRMADDQALLDALASLRDYGALGEQSLPQAIAHADAFVAAIPAGCRRLIDLGSGGGLPGLVLACRLPEVAVVLTDRRERRTDLLRRACARLGLTERVTVVTGDVARLSQRAELSASFNVVTARSFGPPLWTLTCARPFLAESGVVIVSEPPDSDVADRWPESEVAELGLRASAVEFAHVRRFERL